MIRLAVFDLDGTLVDSPRAIVSTFGAAFDALGVTRPADLAVRATIGLPLERAFALLLEREPADAQVAEAVRLYRKFFDTIVLPQAPGLVFPGVVEGLARLREDGVALAVATSKFHAPADALLTAAGLRASFAVVIGADEVTRPKPDPESGQVILERLAVAAEHAVMVGDTTHDLLMAKAAGMRSVAVTYGVHSAAELATAGPTWVADTFEEVVAHLSPVAA
ncbi:HAD family hydrolase [Streptomyces sp. NBC_00536]|uniref:HAD family hydrolase n=1 Tax=Streptomyces sp. NBC_00536 TaxID=2975769 RepID=UPI002E81D8C4|nr:HAD family hydrolase [Streptomyces sp. NBC_00536]WUC82764.1 HAD family hydrolase [Streptomyces sp. NBC_00536]